MAFLNRLACISLVEFQVMHVLMCNSMPVSVGLHGELMLLAGCRDDRSFY